MRGGMQRGKWANFRNMRRTTGRGEWLNVGGKGGISLHRDPESSDVGVRG